VEDDLRLIRGVQHITAAVLCIRWHGTVW